MVGSNPSSPRRALHSDARARPALGRRLPGNRWSLSTVLDEANRLAVMGPVLATFDLPLGVPKSYLEAAARAPSWGAPSSFLDLLANACSTLGFFRGACEYVTNSNRSTAPVMRALLVALDEWADLGIEPPASNYPDTRRGTLATIQEVARTFPAIPGVTFPTVINGLEVLGFGPTFGSEGGRQTLLPPTHGTRYQVLVPTTDSDGHDVAGIHTVRRDARMLAEACRGVPGRDLSSGAPGVRGTTPGAPPAPRAGPARARAGPDHLPDAGARAQ